MNSKIHTAVRSTQHTLPGVSSLIIVGLFLGWIFRNFPLKSPGVNMSTERLAIWTRTMLPWLWTSVEFVSLGSASSLDISDTRKTRAQRCSLAQQHGYSNLPPLSFSLPSLSLLPWGAPPPLHASGLLLFLFLVAVAFPPRCLRVGGYSVWNLNVCQTSMCGGVCAVAGRGCLACYSNTAEWGRCWVTQSRTASFHRQGKKEEWV